MSNYESFKAKLQTQPVFFTNSAEDAVIRSSPNESVYFVKFKGESEFKALRGSSVVAEGIREHNEITKEQYEKF